MVCGFSTPLKNISQIGLFSQVRKKNKPPPRFTVLLYFYTVYTSIGLTTRQTTGFQPNPEIFATPLLTGVFLDPFKAVYSGEPVAPLHRFEKKTACQM